MFKTLAFLGAALAACLFSADAFARCGVMQESDLIVTVRKSVVVTTPGLPSCTLRRGDRIGVNTKCGCVDGRGRCDILRFRNDHVYSGTIPEVTGGKCTIRRGVRCRPRNPRDCP